MDKFKDFYYNKKGKYILFFGFYLIFFIFFGFYIKSLKANNPKEETKEEQKQVEKITTYNISKLISNDYSYDIEITDNEDLINFHGTKNNIDYANYSNKYFLDIYNINQLLKRSKLINTDNFILTYELSNKEINDILLTERKDGINKIMVYVNDKTEVNKIFMDLSNYLEKDVYQINIIYKVGEEDENSPS